MGREVENVMQYGKVVLESPRWVPLQDLISLPGSGKLRKKVQIETDRYIFLTVADKFVLETNPGQDCTFHSLTW